MIDLKGAPGGTWWLLRHEVRMYFNATRKLRANGKVSASWLGKGLSVLLQLVLHWGAYMLVFVIDRLGATPTLAAMLATAGLLVGVTLMLAAALRGSVAALFERGDLDLLLSSPLPAASVFFTRLLGIVVSVASMFLFFLAPLANIGLLTGHPRWLALYVVVIALALLVSSCSMLLTLVLVRVIGARRTKVLVQVLSAIAGALVFLLTQAANSRNEFGATLQGLLHSDWSAVLWLGHAVLGQPAPLAGLLAAGVALFFFTTRTTRSFFVRGVQQAAGSGRAAAAPPGGPRFNFGRGLVWATMVKEWRLIGRDTRLLTQVLLRLLYMVPLGFLVFKNSASTNYTAGASLVFVCASLAGSLAWIIMAAEDAPDLLAGAPRSARVLGRAKLAAATVPPLALVLLPALWLAVRQPLAGVVIILALLLSSLASAYIVQWSGRPAPRAEFNRRSGSGVGGILQAISCLAWAAAAWLLLSGVQYSVFRKWAALALGVALAVLLVSWVTSGARLARRKRQSQAVALQVAS